MITKKASARRYAMAIFEIAEENNTLISWKEDFEKIEVVFQDKVLTAFLNSPSIHFEDKARLLKQCLGDLKPLSLNFLLLLVSKRKANLFNGINEEYRVLVNNYLGIQLAKVKSAVVLSEKEKVSVAEWIGKFTGKKVVIEAEVDSSLLGGIVARIEGKLLDGSIRSKLTALRNELASKR